MPALLRVVLRPLFAILITLPLSGCLDVDPPADGRDDDFATGKADGAITAAETRAVLDLVNRASLAELDHDVPLDARAARNIVGHRDGADGAPGTADDDPFDDLAELDAVPWVGPRALELMVAYAGSAPAERCVIISEYIERWGNYNKAIELHNCGAGEVALSELRICLVRNGDTDCSITDDLGDGSLAAGEVVTLCRRQTAHPAGNDPVPQLAALCELERPGVMTFDGDDRLMVLDASTGDVVDSLGRFGYRPPSGTWAEVILRRCNLTPADGVSYYDHLDYFTEVTSFDLSSFGVAPAADASCP